MIKKCHLKESEYKNYSLAKLEDVNIILSAPVNCIKSFILESILTAHLKAGVLSTAIDRLLPGSENRPGELPLWGSPGCVSLGIRTYISG